MGGTFMARDRKLIKKRRSDGVTQGYHVGVGVDGPQAGPGTPPSPTRKLVFEKEIPFSETERALRAFAAKAVSETDSWTFNPSAGEAKLATASNYDDDGSAAPNSKGLGMEIEYDFPPDTRSLGQRTADAGKRIVGRLSNPITAAAFVNNWVRHQVNRRKPYKYDQNDPRASKPNITPGSQYDN